jgi:4-hydroxybenzoate polyprenyltransferase
MNTPLVVDLDRALIDTDILVEGFFRSAADRFTGLLNVSLRSSGASGDARLAGIDVATLPYNRSVLELIDRARREGRDVYVAAGTDEELAKDIVEHLGLFTGWFASGKGGRLSGTDKAKQLVHRFGDRGFDYVGNDPDDLDVWAHAAKAVVVRGSPRVIRELTDRGIETEIIPHEGASFRDWLALLRIHQYVKNVLIFVPLLTAHALQVGPILDAVLAFIAFCLCASSAYVINDLIDLQADRQHPTKSARPLASGKIWIWHAVFALPILLGAAIAIALTISWAFLAILLSYLALTIAYSLVLKRTMILDVVVLAILYTVRVVAGAAAIGVMVSEWLLAFSIFMFTALALIKRYTELTVRLDSRLAEASDRNYRTDDLNVVAALTAASGFNAVTVFALYVSSDAVRQLYHRPQVLWLICPILIYWIARLIMMANRRLMHDDPVVFALKDRNSLLAAALIGALMILAL